MHSFAEQCVHHWGHCPCAELGPGVTIWAAACFTMCCCIKGSFAPIRIYEQRKRVTCSRGAADGDQADSRADGSTLASARHDPLCRCWLAHLPTLRFLRVWWRLPETGELSIMVHAVP